jgi:hypothetical protein
MSCRTLGDSVRDYARLHIKIAVHKCINLPAYGYVDEYVCWPVRNAVHWSVSGSIRRLIFNKLCEIEN